VALWLAAYNYTRYHKSIRCTPAMRLGITPSIWKVADLVDIAGW
jgi:hypothetical protein